MSVCLQKYLFNNIIIRCIKNNCVTLNEYIIGTNVGLYQPPTVVHSAGLDFESEVVLQINIRLGVVSSGSSIK